MFPHSDFMRVLSCLYNLAYPLSHSFTNSIKSTTFWMSSFSNCNANNIRSITLIFSSSASSLKVQSTLKSVIRGVLLSKLIGWPISLIPPVKSSASEHYACVIAVILLLSKIMPTYSYCVLKGLIYIAIITPLGRQPSSYIKCTKLNIRLSCDIRSVFNAKYIFLIYSYIL